MFFRSRRRRSSPVKPVAADHRDAGIPETTQHQTQRLEDWRRSAQGVTRAWNAGSRPRAARRRCGTAPSWLPSQTKNEQPRTSNGWSTSPPRDSASLRLIRGMAAWARGERKRSDIPALRCRPSRQARRLAAPELAPVGALEPRVRKMLESLLADCRPARARAWMPRRARSRAPSRGHKRGQPPARLRLLQPASKRAGRKPR